MVDNCLFRQTNRMPEMLVVVVEENWSIFQKMNRKKLVGVVGIRSVDQKRNKKQNVVNGVGVVAIRLVAYFKIKSLKFSITAAERKGRNLGMVFRN